MRELKFRAWDTKYKKMIFTGFHLVGKVMAFNQIEGYLFETKEVDGIPTLERWNDIETMQYTGLKDKNGKEIYEGDIILNEHNHRMEVFYHLSEDQAEWAGRLAIFKSGGFILGWFGANLSEVIGNIYENPD